MLGGGWGVERSAPPSLEAMSACSFTGKGDGPVVQQMLAELEWIILSTMAQVLEDHATTGKTISRKELTAAQMAMRRIAALRRSESERGRSFWRVLH